MKEFERIINQAIASAENVGCGEREFKVGLATMFHTLLERIKLEGFDPQSTEMLEELDRLEVHEEVELQ